MSSPGQTKAVEHTCSATPSAEDFGKSALNGDLPKATDDLVAGSFASGIQA
jgi:hypothetical protein